MSTWPGVSRVVIVPRNGYVNRLQAWVSAALLARSWHAALDVLWETEEVAPAELPDLVDVGHLASNSIDPSEVTDFLGVPHQEMARYLTIDPHRGIAFLAGHDRGEQVFMEKLHAGTLRESSISTVVIVAGGKFHLPGQVDFDAQRRAFYEGLPWQQAIRARVERFTEQVPSYVGLHIRETDRSRDAPSRLKIDEALRSVCAACQVRDVFIAADTADARDRWSDRLLQLNLTPWSHNENVLDRTDHRAGQTAIADWLTLGNAQGLVYSSASSFGQEAAVMCAKPGLTLGLRAGPLTRASRDVRRIIGNGLGRLGIH